MTIADLDQTLRSRAKYQFPNHSVFDGTLKYVLTTYQQRFMLDILQNLQVSAQENQFYNISSCINTSLALGVMLWGLEDFKKMYNRLFLCVWKRTKVELPQSAYVFSNPLHTGDVIYHLRHVKDLENDDKRNQLIDQYFDSHKHYTKIYSPFHQVVKEHSTDVEAQKSLESSLKNFKHNFSSKLIKKIRREFELYKTYGQWRGHWFVITQDNHLVNHSFMVIQQPEGIYKLFQGWIDRFDLPYHMDNYQKPWSFTELMTFLDNLELIFSTEKNQQYYFNCFNSEDSIPPYSFANGQFNGLCLRYMSASFDLDRIFTHIAEIFQKNTILSMQLSYPVRIVLRGEIAADQGMIMRTSKPTESDILILYSKPYSVGLLANIDPYCDLHTLSSTIQNLCMQKFRSAANSLKFKAKLYFTTPNPQHNVLATNLRDITRIKFITLPDYIPQVTFNLFTGNVCFPTTLETLEFLQQQESIKFSRRLETMIPNDESVYPKFVFKEARRFEASIYMPLTNDEITLLSFHRKNPFHLQIEPHRKVSLAEADYRALCGFAWQFDDDYIFERIKLHDFNGLFRYSCFHDHLFSLTKFLFENRHIYAIDIKSKGIQFTNSYTIAYLRSNTRALNLFSPLLS